MYCIICGAKFVSSCEGKTCPTCDGAVNRMFPGISAEHLLELVKAEQDGRLVVLPVKIGDKIFRLFGGEITELLVSNVIYRAAGGDASKALVECIPFHRVYWHESFGKTVFLTREDAEAALEGENNGRTN